MDNFAPSVSSNSRDDGDEVDIDIRRMSADAFSILDSIKDEVAGIEGKRTSSSSNPGSKSREIAASNQSNAPTSPKDAIENGISYKPLPKKKSVRNVNANDTKSISSTNSEMKSVRSEEDDMSYDASSVQTPRTETTNRSKRSNADDTEGEMSDDESIIKEMYALRSVTRQIEKELQNQNAESMKDAISRIQMSPGLRGKRTIDDEVIIKRILEEERRKQLELEKSQTFLQRNRLYGPGVGGENLNLPLLAFVIVVWAVLIGMAIKIKYGEAL